LLIAFQAEVAQPRRDVHMAPALGMRLRRDLSHLNRACSFG
jgi:hypothetical protein